MCELTTEIGCRGVWGVLGIRGCREVYGMKGMKREASPHGNTYQMKLCMLPHNYYRRVN